MFIKFKVLVNTSPEKYEIQDCDVLAMFGYECKTHYIALHQPSKYDRPYLMFLNSDNVLEIVDGEIPEDWVKTKNLESNCCYDGIVHFTLDLYDVLCPAWMVENSTFFANVLDNSRGYDQLFKFAPDKFKNKDDIEIWNKV